MIIRLQNEIQKLKKSEFWVECELSYSSLNEFWVWVWVKLLEFEWVLSVSVSLSLKTQTQLIYSKKMSINVCRLCKIAFFFQDYIVLYRSASYNRSVNWIFFAIRQGLIVQIDPGKMDL